MRPTLPAAALALAACAPALRGPATLPPPAPAERDAAELLRGAEAAWAERAAPGRAAEAEALYLRAASADAARVEGLVGAMAALAFRIEREGDGARAELATRAVGLGEECRRRAPASPACAYRLAIALGQQARERSATALDALGRMVSLLREAAVADPGLDEAGPHRVLALVLLRAPGWPLGPGDPEAALEEAHAAAALFPEAPANALALAEALARNGRPAEARATWERAAALAGAMDASRVPEAASWRAEAEAALRGGSR